MFRHASARTRGDRELAADLAQDTFEAAARAWDTLRGQPAAQRAWLLSTLAHKDVGGFRHQEAFRRRQPAIHARYQPPRPTPRPRALKAGDALSGCAGVLESAPPGQLEESRQAPTAESGG